MRKNLALTLWLVLPILVFGGLVAWIFVTMSRPPLMDEAARGPGASDTGGANALGEWLAGRNPNDVQRANAARRQGLAVDPFWWPGGTEIVVAAPDSRPVSVGWIDADTGLLRAVVLRRGTGGDGVWSAVLRDNRPGEESMLYVSGRGMQQRIRDGRREVVDDGGQVVLPRPIAPVPAEGTLPSEPIMVRLEPPG
ncbi:MAG: hypothetical protein LAT64_01750 [Phycisphaerales bacterium]|nr:hypothetical protein [Planctomycetota bacterium]MCH8507486.1 hypothetical protein [Phycisphaerales bacterium]